MKLPTLYQRTNTGALQAWTIEVEENIITTRWGQMEGAIQSTHDLIKQGKNVGRSNETSKNEQAKLEALSRWDRKIKKGYVKDREMAMAGEVDSSVIEGGVFPMLAHRYDKSGHKIQWPAYAQPKLDGHRCIVVARNGKVTLWTRSRKPIESMPHIVEAFEKEAKRSDFIIDGELYNHAYHDKFEELSSFIMQQKPKLGCTVVHYHIYDMPSVKGGYEKRLERLRELVKRMGSGPLRLVETREVFDDNDLTLAFEYFTEQGYEGAMVRNRTGEYLQDHKSYDLLKVKKFMDEEFKIIGVKEGRGKLAGHAIFICEISKGKTFDAKMKGSISKLKMYWDNPELAIGKMITVQFQGYMKSGKPRFPVALRFRPDYKGGKI